jgi:hypothetical protein
VTESQDCFCNFKKETPTKTTSNSNESLDQIYDKLGVSFAPLTEGQKQYFNINSGVVVTKARVVF